MRTPLSVVLLFVFVACGPTARQHGVGGGDDDGVDAPPGACPMTAENTAAACSDGIDNDCDGLTDCQDPDCSGIGSCPVCGMVEHPLGSPLPLPDGVGGTTCTTDASCPAGQHCYNLSAPGDPAEMECRASYTSSVMFTDFAQGQTFTSISNIQSVCVNMEHSWLRDLQIDLISPSGQKVALEQFGGQTGGEIYLGMANDCDDDATPVPGVGADYCWSPTATKPDWLDYANGNGAMASVTGCDGGSHQEMPPDTYSASSTFSPLIGATLNGAWTIAVTDLWPIDNGYMFKWSINFDPSILSTCTGPIIQ